MNAQGVISVCVSIWTHRDLNGWTLCTLDKISFCSEYILFSGYFWNHQTIVLCFWTWHTICLNHGLRTQCTVWVVISLAATSLLSSVKVFIQVSIKLAHSCAIKLVNWMPSSCNTVAIELIADLFMWHHHKWTYACFCMHSARSMQSIFDLVHALFCHWTVNLWMCSCDIIAIKICNGMSLHFIRAGLFVLTICCDPTTNRWLRGCSHNYQCVYCWNIIAITKWSAGFHPDCYINATEF